jgi:5-methyltetrahydrofolate--homocysteine methyltransferase
MSPGPTWCAACTRLSGGGQRLRRDEHVRANLGNLGEYGITERIGELSEAGARIAREEADRWSTPERSRFVLGSMGPGTKLPTLGHVDFATLRDAYADNAAGLLAGGVDALIVETSQDLLQTKAAVIGAKRAMARTGRDVTLVCQVTVETTGTMLLGTEIGAALTALEPLDIDLIGLNCATGPEEYTEHLRYLSQHARIPLSVMPQRRHADPQARGRGLSAHAGPVGRGAAASSTIRRRARRRLLRHTPEHIARLPARARPRRARRATSTGFRRSTTTCPLRRTRSVLLVGERTNANGSKAFREAMLAGDHQKCVEIAREQARDGSHMLDLNVDYVGRDGAADMRDWPAGSPRVPRCRSCSTRPSRP